MFHLIWVLIVGGVIGAIAGMITSRDLPAGIVGNIVGGIVGSFIGQTLFGTWGPQVANMAIVPSIIGAIIFVAVISLIFGLRKRA